MFGKKKEPDIDTVADYVEGEGAAEDFRNTVRETIEANDIPMLQYATHDATWIASFYTDPDLAPFKPLLTQLLRLTRVNDKEKDDFKDKVEYAYTMLTMFMPESEMSSPRGVKIELASTALKLMINDSHKGFKLTVLTTVKKVLQLQRENQKQKQGEFQ